MAKIRTFFIKLFEAITEAQMRKAATHLEQMKRNGFVGGWE